MTTVFVTGGSGFVGQHLIPKLVETGYKVLALARSSGSLAKVESLGASGVAGDLTMPHTWSKTLGSCDIVVHSAAYIEFTKFFEHDRFHRINVQATQELLDLARASGVKKLIYIGAALVVVGGTVVDINEEYEPPSIPDDLYLRSKAVAERRVIGANRPHFETVVLRPPAIWGPNDPHFDGVFSSLKEGKWIWVGRGKHVLSTIHVHNLSTAIIATIQRGVGGEIYFVTDGEKRPMREFFHTLFEAHGFHPGNRTLPRFLAKALALFVAFLYKTLRIHGRAPIAPVLVDIMGREFSVSDQKARSVLGYRNAISIDEGIQGIIASRPA